MKALTLRQPHAFAIFHGKDVENRSRMFSHRGPLLIHAGAAYAGQDAFEEVTTLTGLPLPLTGTPSSPPAISFSAIIGVVDLVSAHRSGECEERCSPWAPFGQAHHRLSNARVFARSVPCPGSQGLWTPDDDTMIKVKEQLR